MIARQTVLILGAGASVDYGFPTGRRLLLDICTGATPNNSIFVFLRDQMGRPEHEISRFQVALQRSGAPSVDLFLEQRQDFEEIGKLAIAASLIPRESRNAFAPRDEIRWYELLFELMVEGGPFEENPLSVLTFNYDRSLEAFFRMALENFYGFNRPTPLERLHKIPILHLYGSLGDNRPYEPKLTPELARIAAGSIKIMHEVTPSVEFERAKDLLQEADEILFLGFGFHAINLDRLNLERLAAWKINNQRNLDRWFACRTGMGEGDIARARAYPGVAHISFAQNSSWGIVEFLKNTPCLIPSQR